MEQLVQLSAVGGTLALLWLTLEGLRRLRINKGKPQRVLVQRQDMLYQLLTYMLYRVQH